MPWRRSALSRSPFVRRTATSSWSTSRDASWCCRRRATETLFAIGAGRQVIAVDDQSNYPARAPQTKLSSHRPNAEAVAKYKPDLVDHVVGGEQAAAGAAQAQDPGAAGAVRRRTSVPRMRRCSQIGAATGHRPAAATADRADEARHRRGRAIRSSKARGLSVFHELSPDFYSATVEDVHRPRLRPVRLSQHRRRGRQARVTTRSCRASTSWPRTPTSSSWPTRSAASRRAAVGRKRPGWSSISAVRRNRRRRGQRRHRLALGAADRRLHPHRRAGRRPGAVLDA